MSYQINNEDVVVKIRLLNHKTILAQAEVTILDTIQSTGWTVRTSEFINPRLNAKIRIKPPQQAIGGGRYLNLIKILDKSLYTSIETKITQEYQCLKAEGEQFKQATDIVNIDDIPF